MFFGFFDNTDDLGDLSKEDHDNIEKVYGSFDKLKKMVEQKSEETYADLKQTDPKAFEYASKFALAATGSIAKRRAALLIRGGAASKDKDYRVSEQDSGDFRRNLMMKIYLDEGNPKNAHDIQRFHGTTLFSAISAYFKNRYSQKPDKQGRCPFEKFDKATQKKFIEKRKRNKK